MAGPIIERDTSLPHAEDDVSLSRVKEDVALDPTYPTIKELLDAMDNALWRSLPPEECPRREATI